MWTNITDYVIVTGMIWRYLPDSAVVLYSGGVFAGPTPAALYASTATAYLV